MNEFTKTLIFVGLAIVLVGAAAWSGMKSSSRDDAEFALVGEPFFPEFTDPNEANGLNVIRYDEDTATADRFSIQNKAGHWVIPSHFDYPADARDQLAKTASSVVGIERGALVGRRSADFERLGVVDPVDEESTTLKGRGNRITLVKDNNTLTDLIIGKKSEGQDDMYYVRRPDEDQTYLAKLNIDLSTKFTDWIEDDLLSLEKANLKEIIVHRYSIDEASGRILDQGYYTLDKPEGSQDFQLADLKPTEEMVPAKVNGLISQLDDLRIVGIRRKPEGLSSDLKLNKDVSQDLLTSLNLQSKGFYFIQERSGEMRLVSNDGELAAKTNDGLVYIMHFGDIVTGNEDDIEVGFATIKDGEEKPDEPTDKPSVGKNRYLFLTVNYDASVLGEKPTKPVKPEEPKAEETKPAEEQPSEATTEQPAVDKTSEEKPAEEKAEEIKVGELRPDPQQAYELALKDYEAKLKTYEEELKAYNERLDEGKKKAKDLNARFADWYYVISGDSFEEFSLQRSDLVQEKQAEAKEEPAQSKSLLENLPFKIPGMTAPKTEGAPTTPTVAPETETPKTETSETESPKPEPTPESTPPVEQ